MVKPFTVNADHHSIRCELHCNNPHKIGVCVLYGHGFGGHKQSRAAIRFADAALRKVSDSAVVTFDWPGHGEDVKKKWSLADCDSYLRILTAYLKDRFPLRSLHGCATSFGGFLFLRYISEFGSPFERIALRSPAVDMYQALRTSILTEENAGVLARGGVALVGFDRKVPTTPALIDEIRAENLSEKSFLDMADRLFILHGTKDEIIPFESVQRFADANLIPFLGVQNADHRFQDQALMGLAIREILNFLDLK